MTRRGLPFLCSVQGLEVIELAAELEALGGGDVALASTQAIAFVPAQLAADGGLVVGTQRYRVDTLALEGEAGPVASKLSRELWGWATRGLCATALMLPGTQHCVSAASLISQVAVAALSAGATVGLSWQSGGEGDPGGQPAGRLGLAAAASVAAGTARGQGSAARSVVCAGSLGELESLLQMALSGGGSSSSDSRGGRGGSSLLTLHLHHAGSGSLAEVNVVVVPEEEEGLVLRLLKELASVRKQQAAGEHPLVASTLSLFTQAAAPLIAGPLRLLVMARVDGAQADAAQKAAVLEQISSMRVVCSRNTGTKVADLAWIHFSEYQDQRRLVEEHHQQEQAAAVAAAAATARRQQQRQPQSRPSSALRLSKSRGSSRLGQGAQRSTQQEELGCDEECGQQGAECESAGAAEAGLGAGSTLCEAPQPAVPPAESLAGSAAASPQQAAPSQEGQTSHAQPHRAEPPNSSPPHRPCAHSVEGQEAEEQSAGAGYAAQALQRRVGRGAARRVAQPGYCARQADSGSRTSSPSGPRPATDTSRDGHLERAATACALPCPEHTSCAKALPSRAPRQPYQQQQQPLPPPPPPQQQQPDGVLQLLRGQFQELYQQAVGPSAASPASPPLGSVPSPRLSTASHDLFSSICAGSSPRWSPAGSLRGRWGHASLAGQPGAEAWSRGESPVARPHANAELFAGQASGSPGSPPRHCLAAGRGARLPAPPQQASPGRPGAAAFDDAVSAHMAMQRLRTAAAEHEQEVQQLQEQQRWQALCSPGHARPAGGGSGCEADEVRSQFPPLPLESAADLPDAKGAAGLGLLHEHLLRQQRLFEAEEQLREHQRCRERQQGPSSAASDRPEAAELCSPSQPDKATAVWLGRDEDRTLAHLEDAALSLGAITHPPPSSGLPRWGATPTCSGRRPGDVGASALGFGEDDRASSCAKEAGEDGPGAAPQAPDCAGGGDGLSQGGSALDNWLSSTAALLGTHWQGGNSPAQPASSPAGVEVTCASLRMGPLTRRTAGADSCAARPTVLPAAPGRLPSFAPPSEASSSCPNGGGCAEPDARRQREPSEESSAPFTAVLGQDSPIPLAASYAQLAAEQRQRQRQLHEQQPAEQPPSLAAEDAPAQTLAAGDAPPLADPADFNSLLAALQRERRVSAGLQRDLQAQQQASAERILGMELQLATLGQKLADLQARCRGWEQGSPFSELFGAYEGEVGRLEAEGRQLREENRALARLLADSELSASLGPPGSMAPDAAAVSRELQRRLQQSQAAVRRLEGEREALLADVQGMRRKDRLAVLYRRQAEELLRRSQEMQRVLASREQQLEQQCLNAAESGARADILEEQLGGAERRAREAAAENADLRDTVESLRQQVHLLRSSLGRDRVLQHMQAKG